MVMVPSSWRMSWLSWRRRSRSASDALRPTARSFGFPSVVSVAPGDTAAAGYRADMLTMVPPGGAGLPRAEQDLFCFFRLKG